MMTKMKKTPKTETKAEPKAETVSIPVSFARDYARALLDGCGVKGQPAPALPAIVDGQEIACWLAVTKDVLRDALARAEK